MSHSKHQSDDPEKRKRQLDNLRPFQKGDDPRRNTDGRPKGAKSRSTVVKRWMEVEQTVSNPITGETQVLSQEDIIILSTINQARKGNISAFRELMDSVYGKAEETVNLNDVTTPVEFIEVIKAPEDPTNSDDD